MKLSTITTILIGLALVIFASCAVPASAGELELGVHAGASSGPLAASGGGSIGWNLNDHVALEADYDTVTVHKAWITLDPLTQLPVRHQGFGPAGTPTMNLKLSGPTWVYFQPYLIAGVGYQFALNRDNFAYAYGGGVRYVVSKHVSLDFRYRHETAGDSHGLVTSGLSYRF